MSIFFWILFVYFIATTIAFTVGIGPKNGEQRNWHWWERVLSFPVWSLSTLANKFPIFSIPCILILNLYSMMCYPLLLLHEKYEMYKWNKERK